MSEASRCRYCDKALVMREGRWRAVESRWLNDAHCHYSAQNGVSVGHEPRETAGEAVVHDLRDAECGSCGEALMRDGEMLGTSFAIPANGDKGDILCEGCARRVGVWED